MLRRAVLLFLLVFQSLWLAVVLPGHTRGVVTLPGFKPAPGQNSVEVVPDCCSSHKQTPSDSKFPSDGGRAAHCAICFFAARLTMPVVIDLTPAPLRLARVLPPVESEYCISLDCSPTYLGRAPPTA